LGLAFGEGSDDVTPVATASPPALAPDTPDPPITVEDGRVCLYRRSGEPPAERFVVGGRSVELLPNQYACVQVAPGMVKIAWVGADGNFAVGPQTTAYVRVFGRFGLGRTDPIQFDRVKRKLTDVSAVQPPVDQPGQ